MPIEDQDAPPPVCPHCDCWYDTVPELRETIRALDALVVALERELAGAGAVEVAELGMNEDPFTEIHGGKPCCHPPCGGKWGANCPHCHWLDHKCPQ